MSDKVTKYVAGLLFDDKGYVALISKTHPLWQKGKLNGIGGHIEEGETPQQAMIREFSEEAGLILNWRKFVIVRGDNYEVHWFTSRLGNKNVDICTMTDESVRWYLVDKLPENILPSLRWLIPMADYKFELIGEIVHESPTC